MARCLNSDNESIYILGHLGDRFALLDVMRILVLILLFSLRAMAQEVSADILQTQKEELAILQNAEDISLGENEILFIDVHVLFNTQDDGFRKLVYSVWKQFLAENRIKRLTPGLRAKLSLDKSYCSTPTHCNELMAAYLPLSNFILVDFDKVDLKSATWFYHELVHAVQYIYRLPLDLNLLLGRVPKEELVDYLRFYYESQANWYTMRLRKNSDWKIVEQGAISSGLEAAAKVAFGLPTAGVTSKIARESFNELLPIIDQMSGSQLNRQLFELKELPVIKTYHSFNPGIHVDLGFFKSFVRSIEKAYFGNLVFLYKDDNEDQKIYRDLHNQFYKFFASNELIKTCDSAFKKVSADSPLLTWLRADESQLRCGPYQSLSFWQSRGELLNLFVTNRSQFFHAGTKGGGGPGLVISPLVQPQLRILPGEE